MKSWSDRNNKVKLPEPLRRETKHTVFDLLEKTVNCICAGRKSYLHKLEVTCKRLCFIIVAKLITCYTDEKWKLASFHKEYIHFDLEVCFWFQLFNLESQFCMHMCRYVVKSYLHRIKCTCMGFWHPGQEVKLVPLFVIFPKKFRNGRPKTNFTDFQKWKATFFFFYSHQLLI